MGRGAGLGRIGLPRIDIVVRGRLFLIGLSVIVALAAIASLFPFHNHQIIAAQTLTGRLLAAGQAYILLADGEAETVLASRLEALSAEARQLSGHGAGRPPRARRALPEGGPFAILGKAEALASGVLAAPPDQPAARAARLKDFAALTARFERATGSATPNELPDILPLFLALLMVGFGAFWLGVQRPLVRRLERTRRFIRQVRAHRQSAREAIAEAERRAAARLNLIAVVSHDVRTLLNGVLGTASLLMGAKLEPSEAERVRTIESSGKSMLSVLNDLLDFSRIESGKLELERIDFSLRGLLDETSALWQSSASSKGITFSLDYAQAVPDVVVGDPTRFKQIINNLISNAVKFTKQGSVRLLAEREQSGAGEVILRFHVVDTGVGMTEEAQARVFEAYGQADAAVQRNFGGTGLGLAITRRLVRLMGGEVDLKSAPGQGTTVSFTAPFALGDPSRVSQEESAALMPVLRSPASLPRVLIAEDHPVNQKIVVAMLASQGYEMDVVGTGKDAVDRVQQLEYGLILMDVQMPVMDGITATGEIRKLGGKFAELPIIALTANAMAGDRETYLEAGMTDYLSKPIDPIRLFAVIAKHCGLGDAAPAPPPVRQPGGDKDAAPASAETSVAAAGGGSAG